MKRRIAVAILSTLCLILFFSLANTHQALQQVRAELNLTKSELASTQSALRSTEAKLTKAESELKISQAELTSTQAKLTKAESELKIKQAELTKAQDELKIKQAELIDVQISYQGLIKGRGYTIKDPTYNEMMRFINEDKTDENQFIKDKYECRHFAMDVCNNAKKKGIRCAYVSISFPAGSGHAIVVFNTIDRGLIYIEPQEDDLARPVIGKRYWTSCVEPKPGHYYKEPDYNDTIWEILIIW